MTSIEKVVILMGMVLLSTVANAESKYKHSIKVESLEENGSRYLLPEDIILNELQRGNRKAFVKDITSKTKNNNKIKSDLEFLVASVNDKEVISANDKLIGAFDKEKFSSTWEELQSLVDNSENSVAKQRVLQMELEELVLDASSKQKSSHSSNDMVQIEKKVKKMLDNSIKNISSSNSTFITNIVSDITTDAIEIVDSSEDWIKIKIKTGDTLSSLAKKYYGQSTQYMLIYNANRDKIGSDYVIYVGDIINIPTLNQIQGI